jgi:hypothetical protein
METSPLRRALAKIEIEEMNPTFIKPVTERFPPMKPKIIPQPVQKSSSKVILNVSDSISVSSAASCAPHFSINNATQWQLIPQALNPGLERTASIPKISSASGADAVTPNARKAR